MVEFVTRCAAVVSFTAIMVSVSNLVFRLNKKALLPFGRQGGEKIFGLSLARTAPPRRHAIPALPAECD